MNVFDISCADIEMTNTEMGGKVPVTNAIYCIHKPQVTLTKKYACIK